MLKHAHRRYDTSDSSEDATAETDTGEALAIPVSSRKSAPWVVFTITKGYYMVASHDLVLLAEENSWTDPRAAARTKRVISICRYFVGGPGNRGRLAGSTVVFVPSLTARSGVSLAGEVFGRHPDPSLDAGRSVSLKFDAFVSGDQVPMVRHSPLLCED